MKLKNKVIKLRKYNPLMPTRQIARELNMAVSWTHTILKKANLITNPPRKIKWNTCRNNHCSILFKENRRFCTHKCRYEYMTPLIVCSFCHVEFRRKRHSVLQGLNRGDQNFYCSRKCFMRGRSDT